MDTIKSVEFEEDALDGRQKKFLSVLESCLGVVSTACAQGNVPRSTFYLWKRENEAFADAVAEIEDVALDFAESKLHDLINDGDTTATIFYLKCKGKKRGYTDKLELEHSGKVGAPVAFQFIPHGCTDTDNS